MSKQKKHPTLREGGFSYHPADEDETLEEGTDLLEEGEDLEEGNETGANIDGASESVSASELPEDLGEDLLPSDNEELIGEDLPEEVMQEVRQVVEDLNEKTEALKVSEEPTAFEISQKEGRPARTINQQEATMDKMAFGNVKDSKEKASRTIGGRTVFKEKPAKENRVSKLSDTDVAKFNKDKFVELMAPEVGQGRSKLSGKINIHVSIDAIEGAIVKLIRGSVAEAATRGIDIAEYAETFIASIKGVSTQIMTSAAGKVSLASFADTVYSILVEQPKYTDQTAKKEAASIVTSYTGQNIIEMKNDASFYPAQILTLLVERKVVPEEEDGSYALILKGFTNDVRHNDSDEEYVRITIALDKVLAYAQSDFPKMNDFFGVARTKDISLFSATIINVNNILHEVVYTVIKEDR